MSKTILIADDSEGVRELVKSTLENEGYNVLVSVDGSDALKFLDGSEIHLVITDLYMPKMNGINLIKEIRRISDYQYVPILFLTTESQLEKKLEGKAAGATGWIVKPFVSSKLLSIIRKVIRN